MTMKTPTQNQHAEFMAAALAQIEAIKAAIQQSAERMEREPENWAITGDMGAILQRLKEVTP